MKYRLKYKIRGHEICPDYRLNRLFIMHYFHDCFANYCTDRKLAAFDLQEENKTWIMTEIKIDFEDLMPKWRETVDFETWTRKISPLRTEQDFYVYYNDKKLAKGTSRWVVINETSRKPVSYAPLTDILQCIDDKVYSEFKFNKIPTFDTIDFQIIQKIKTDEVDFNMHLNSIKYIIKALDVIPVTFRENHIMKSFQAKYSQESVVGDQLQSVAKQENTLFRHQLRKKTENGYTTIFNMISEWK